MHLFLALNSSWILINHFDRRLCNTKKDGKKLVNDKQAHNLLKGVSKDLWSGLSSVYSTINSFCFRKFIELDKRPSFGLPIDTYHYSHTCSRLDPDAGNRIPKSIGACQTSIFFTSIYLVCSWIEHWCKSTWFDLIVWRAALPLIKTWRKPKSRRGVSHLIESEPRDWTTVLD